MLKNDFAVRQQARQVDEQPARRDDGAVTLDLRFDGQPQRDLHVRGGELESSIGRAEQYCSRETVTPDA